MSIEFEHTCMSHCAYNYLYLYNKLTPLTVGDHVNRGMASGADPENFSRGGPTLGRKILLHTPEY